MAMCCDVTLDHLSDAFFQGEQLVGQTVQNSPLHIFAQLTQRYLSCSMVNWNITSRKERNRSPKNVSSPMRANKLQPLQCLSAMRSCVIEKVAMHRVAVCLKDEPTNRVEPALARCQRINTVSINLCVQQLQRRLSFTHGAWMGLKPRAEWCRGKDVGTRTEPRTRHPLQHDCSARWSFVGLEKLREELALSLQPLLHFCPVITHSLLRVC